MSDALINQLPSILIALATLVTAFGGVVIGVLNRNKIVEQGAKIEKQSGQLDAIDTAHQAKLDAIGQKVDGGMAKLQDALAQVAVTATAQPTKREHRATDKREPE